MLGFRGGVSLGNNFELPIRFKVRFSMCATGQEPGITVDHSLAGETMRVKVTCSQ